MYHTCAWFANTGPITDGDIPFLQDDIQTKQNNHLVLQTPKLLLAAAAMAPNLTRAKFSSPTLKQISSPWIRPTIASLTPGNNPNVWYTRNNPIHLVPFEEIQILASDTVGTTENLTVVAHLADSIDPWPAGDVYPIRFTSTGAAVANAWTTVALTWQDTLPPGIYQMVYSECESANGQAHRWIFPNQLVRPGHLSCTAVTQRQPYESLKLPSMGSFRSNALPLLQVLCNGADASHEGYAWVTRTGLLS